MKLLHFVFLAGCVLWGLTACSQQKFSGQISNGYKGDKISFVLSKDKKSISLLTFDGYWRCSGSIESIIAGPAKTIPVTNGKVHAVVSEPENGGASAFRFAIDVVLKGNTATGTFRMSITGLSCDTYLLKFTAKTN